MNKWLIGLFGFRVMKTSIKTLRGMTILFLGVMITSCDMKVNMPVLPNVGGGNDSSTLTDQSKSGSRNKTKTYYSNIEIDERVEDALKVDRDENCAQLVELPGEIYVIDFSNVPCPGGKELVPVDSIVFTCSYSAIEDEDNKFQIEYKGNPIGEMERDGGGGTDFTLKQMCSDSYLTYCIILQEDGKFSSKPVVF